MEKIISSLILALACAARGDTLSNFSVIHWSAPWTGGGPAGVAEWLHAIAFTALGAFAASVIVSALAGRIAPEGEAVELAFPLPSGTYLVVNGGSDLVDRAALRMDMEAALAPLRRRERLIAEDLKHYGNVTDVARARTMARGSVYRCVTTIRERLIESGIDE